MKNNVTRGSLFQVAAGLTLKLAPFMICRAETLYVSTEGCAGLSGKLDKPNAQQSDGPLPALAAARDKIRELRHAGASGAIAVLVRGGIYFLEEPFVLTPEDSGAPGRPLTLAAYPGERAIISGGRRITGWTKKDNRRWSVPVAFEFNQLFIAGKRVMRSRRPNQGYYRVDGRVRQEKPMLFKYRGDTIFDWDVRGGGIRPAGKSWKEWQATGMDRNSVTADPMFVNAANFDFRLKTGSPALKLGFKPIDVSTSDRE